VVIVESVVDLAAVFAASHEAQLAQSAQLMGNGRFGHFELGGKVSNIQFPLEKNGNDPQACRITEGAEQVSEMGKSVFFL
jgi:hypothetical protein